LKRARPRLKPQLVASVWDGYESWALRHVSLKRTRPSLESRLVASTQDGHVSSALRVHCGKQVMFAWVLCMFVGLIFETTGGK
jgi:hypothetical protein